MRPNVAPVLLTLLLGIPHGLGAQGSAAAAGTPEPGAARRAVVAVPLAGAAPAIDGRLDEAVWETAEVAAGFIQLRPQPGAPATERTEARILFDEQALYVGIRLYDSRADSIVAQLARRDQSVYSDWIYIGIDSYHDRRTAYLFGINPAGVKRDLMLQDDTREDAGWDAVWDAAARVDSLGWTAEFRIPFSQLRFAASPRKQQSEATPGRARSSTETVSDLVWGVNFHRQLARRDELSYWAPVPADGAGMVSYYGELRGLRGVRSPRHLEILPYSVARFTRAPGSLADPFHAPNALYGSVGADLRYGLTSNLTLSATLNPDYGQVEADPAQVNLTAFETFVSERRPFFLEGTEIFEAGGPRLFYSRRIGRAPRGAPPADAVYVQAPEASRVVAAAKLTGKTASGWSVGVLSAVTEPAEARYLDGSGSEERVVVEPLTNYSVGRLIRDFRGGQSAVGAIFTGTHRRMAEGLEFLPDAAYAGGLDLRHRFGGGNYQLSGSLHGSHVEGGTAAIGRLQRAAGRYFQRPDAAHLSYDPSRTTLSGSALILRLAKIGGGHWRGDLMGTAYSPGFEINDLGFFSSTDRARGFASLGYEQFRPGRHFRSWDLSSFAISEWSFGGERLMTVFDVTGNLQLRNHWGGSAWAQRMLPALSTNALRGGPALVTPAATILYAGMYSDRRRPLVLRASSYAELREETGGERIVLNSSVSVRASTRAELSLGPLLSWNRDPAQWVGRRQLEESTRYLFGRLDQRTVSLTGRLDYTFTPALSLQLYAQPFLSGGAYSEFKEVADPRAPRFVDRFRTFAADELTVEHAEGGERRYRVDVTGDGTSDLSFTDPSFNIRSLRSNAVLRWEYRPGSTLFVVWSQGRSGSDASGSFDIFRETNRLLQAESTNVLLVKVSYWLGM